MCPGAFPSPTTSRQGSPVPSFEPLPRIPSLSSSRTSSPDFTTPDIFRRRPRFAAPQSEPSLSPAISPKPLASGRSVDSSPVNFKCSAKDRRRVSDPLHSHRRDDVKRHSNGISKPQPKRQRLSSDFQPTSSSPYSHSDTPPPSSTVPDPTTSVLELDELPSPQAIHEKLLREFQKPLNKSDTRGVIYILRHPDKRELGYKIGLTTQVESELRYAQHRRACGFKHCVVRAFSGVDCVKRVERLIHIDLGHRRKLWKCTGAGHKGGNASLGFTVHEEWFDVTKEEAIAVVNKWTTFVNREQPYGWTRRLGPLWTYLLRTRKVEIQFEGDINHEIRREQWDAILSRPTSLDYAMLAIDILDRTRMFLLGIVHQIWPYLSNFCWQIAVVLYSLVMLLVCRNTFASSAFAISAGAACVSVFPHMKLRARGRKSV